jgi:16S rRNA (cytosine967-C5)-methyltransferase
VFVGGAFSNLAIPAELDRAGLGARDRALASELAYGTLRKRIPIDAALSGASARPLEAIDPDPLGVLRLGAYQLMFMRVPVHAAVGETVAMAPPRSRGFVNAVLRSLAREPWRAPDSTDDEGISLRTGLASWAVAELRRVLPDDEVESAASALASPAPLTLRANTCRMDVDGLESALVRAGHRPERGRLHPGVLRLAGGAPGRLPGYEEGWFAIQDEASVLVGAAVEARSGDRILDACAGPGGKAAHLACEAGTEGLVVAADVHPRRSGLVRATARRLGLRIEVLVEDARRSALAPGAFDAVLVDAPCSGLGAARRRPELLWRPEKDHLSSLARLQVAILAGASAAVKTGGRLIYSVCTFPRAETDAALRAFVSKQPDFEPLPVPGPDGPSAVHRVWPHRHGTDAMFYAGFRRR